MKFQSNYSSRASLSSWGSYLEVFGFLLIASFGVYAALTTGISYDEDAEFRTYLVNASAISGLLNGSSEAYAHLMQYVDRYYGIGFHIFSHGLTSVLSQSMDGLLPFSPLGSRLIWGHAAVFIIFLGSGVLFRACLLSLTKDRLIASLGMFTFLLWPYVFGHALMNVKDIPFMFGWLCCTYLALRIFELPSQFSNILVVRILLLGAFTGWLMAIRVSGILIFVEYFWLACFWYFGNRKIKISMTFSQVIGIAGVFLLAFALTILSFYPILWHNPFELINALAFMSSHPWQGDTLTAGELVEPKTRLVFYIAAWQLVKLPLLVIVGLLLASYFMLRDFMRRDCGDRYKVISALYLSVLTIIGLLILQRVALYNELRQILFIAPLLMMIAVVGLRSMSRGFALLALVVTSAFMLIDDLDLHPYQYTYINEVARHTDIGKKYETDYYGLAVKETALWLNNSQVDGKSQCLYVPAKHLWEFAIDPQKFPCVGGYPGDLSLIAKPFLFFVQARSVTSFRAPPWCRVIHAEERSLPFSGSKLRMGELYECLPPIMK
jgi:hypothetical protein